MTAETILTKELLHNLFNYCDGKLFRKSNNKQIGWLVSQGYINANIKNKCYGVHRLIFLMFNGYLPTEIDHINGNKSDNRIENLRASSVRQNQFNAKIRKNSSTGIKNVVKSGQKFNVAIKIDGKRTHIGNFKDLELAELVAIEARNKYHKEFACHG